MPRSPPGCHAVADQPPDRRRHGPGRPDPRYYELDPVTLAATPDTVAAAIDDDMALLLALHPMVGCCDAPGLVELAAACGLSLLRWRPAGGVKGGGRRFLLG